MAIIPNDDTPFTIDSQVPAEAPAGPTEDQMRSQATAIGLDYDRLNGDDLEFVAALAGGRLESMPPAVPGDALEDGSIPPGTPDPVPPTDDTDALATPGAESDDAGVGSASDVTGDGGEPAVPPAPAVTPPEAPAGVTAPPPGPPGYDIPSPLPAVAPPMPAPEATAEPMVLMPDGTFAPLSIAQQVASQFAAQQQQPPTVPTPPPNPWDNGPAVPPTPYGTEYVDERAGQEIAQINEQLAAFRQQQAITQQQAQMQHEAELDRAINDTVTNYAAARKLAPEQAGALLKTATDLGSLGWYAQMYPGDPRRAVGAALENAYWITPEFRQAEIDRAVQEQVASNLEVEKKKALAGQTVSPAGSVPRTPPAAQTREQRDTGMIAMIEAELAKTNGGAPRR